METGIGIFSGISFEKQVECFKKHGIKRTFVSSEIKDFDKVMELFSENGIICETLHAPYDKINDMWGEDEAAAEAILNRLKDSVDKCAKYNIPVTIIHVSSGRPMPEINETGTKRYEELFAYAKEKGVTVALENLRYFENLKYLMTKYEDAGFCWDNGHEYCSTPGVKYIDLYGDRLAALHIHDNRCGFDTDDHFLPFDGAIDMEEIAKDLVKSGYAGTLMLEVGKSITVDGKAVYEKLSDEEYIEKAVASAKKLSDMVEAFRK